MDDLDFPGWEPAKSVQVVEGNGLTQVLVKGQPYMRWQSGDEGCTRLAIVQLYKCGLGTEEDLAAAFGRHINSVQNYLRDFTGEGIQGLMTERRGPKGQWKLTPELRGKILQRSEEHTSELQSRLHVVCRLLLETNRLRPSTPDRQCDRTAACRAGETDRARQPDGHRVRTGDGQPRQAAGDEPEDHDQDDRAEHERRF